MSEAVTINLGDLLASPPEYGANATAIAPEDGNPRYLRITDIDDEGHLLHEDVKSISAIVAQPYLLAQDDIVIARTGNTVGKAYCHDTSNGPLAFAGYLVRFRIDQNKADPGFVSQFLHSPHYRAWVQRTLRTGAQPNINAAEYKKLPIPRFKPITQRRIATILTTMDEVIETTEKLVEKHQQIKAGLMHDLFTRGLWTRPELARGDHQGTPAESTAQEGQLRPTPEEAPGLYQDSPLGSIPKAWKAASLLSISNSMTNGFVGTATPYYSEDEDAVQYLYGNNVRADKLELPSSMRVTRRFHELQRKSQLQPGDMLTVQSGHIGTSAIVPESLGEANCHALIITKFKTSRVVPDFVSYYCNSPGGYQRLGSIFVGSTILHINVKEFKNFAIPLPKDLDEQESICDRLVAINERLDTETTHLAKLRQQKQGLMHDLLTGRVRVER